MPDRLHHVLTAGLKHRAETLAREGARRGAQESADDDPSLIAGLWGEFSQVVRDVIDRSQLEAQLLYLWFHPKYEAERKGLTWTPRDIIEKHWIDMLEQEARVKAKRLRIRKTFRTDEEEHKWIAWVIAVAKERFPFMFELTKQKEFCRAHFAEGRDCADEAGRVERMEQAMKEWEKMFEAREEVMAEEEQRLRKRSECSKMWRWSRWWWSECE